MKVHIVRYTPRTGSRTAQLVDYAVSQLDPSSVTVSDLAAPLPPALDQRTVDAYIQRNYLGQSVDAEAAQALAPLDHYVDALRAADHVILATPMYNFGLPGAVKAWFDAVIQKDRTWTIRDGRYEGWLTSHKALLLYTSGGAYEEAPGGMDLLTPMARQLFGFMGIPAMDVVSAQGTAGGEDAVTQAMSQARGQIDRVLATWRAEAAPASPVERGLHAEVG
ncbi:FMN-dependent NADH-azoreductase [Algiphilus sp.]|uniref:FMN-dependent NADH-azoreductase n=1 Tax=Algiphilus sp. TaxID=1872431 RepID=UPI003B52925E